MTTTLGLWAERQGRWVVIHFGEPLSAIVTNNPESSYYQPALFLDLRRLMLSRGAWLSEDTVEEDASPVTAKPLRFRPGPVSGEPVSLTILRDRGEY